MKWITRKAIRVNRTATCWLIRRFIDSEAEFLFVPAEEVATVQAVQGVTPHMHKVHHSRVQKETDSNYSNIFSFWDRLFGTYTAEIDFQRLHYGLDGFDVKERQTLRGLLKMPFTSYTRA